MSNLGFIVKKHFVDATAQISFGTPFNGFMDTFVAGLSPSHSLRARVMTAGFVYCGLGSLYSRGMDYSRKLFKFSQRKSELIKHAHDAAYTAAFSFTFSLPIYYCSGATSKQALIGSAAAAGLGLFTGGPTGYTVDAYRDLAGIQASERIPSKVRELQPRFKKGLLALLTASSLTALGLVYHFSPHQKPQEAPLPSSLKL